jgi:hypothetical protein
MLEFPSYITLLLALFKTVQNILLRIITVCICLVV